MRRAPRHQSPKGPTESTERIGLGGIKCVIMKLNLRVTLCTAFAVAAAISAFAADDNRTAVALRYQFAGTAFNSVKDALGIETSKAIPSIDPHNNTIFLDPNHPGAEKVRAFLTANDLRPAQAEVSATISETVKAESGLIEKSIVIAKPKVSGKYGEPMTITFGDVARTFTIELVLKHIPGEEPDAK